MRAPDPGNCALKRARAPEPEPHLQRPHIPLKRRSKTPRLAGALKAKRYMNMNRAQKNGAETGAV
jgi:hypothetical protein